MEELQDFSENEESNFDLKAEIFKYLAYWKWIVLGIVVGVAVAYLYNRYTIPEYRTEASMMILKEDQTGVAGALPSSGGASILIDNTSLANQIETLTSKRLVGDVIDELNLNFSYFIQGNVIAVEAYEDSPIRVEFVTPDSIVHLSSLSFQVTPESGSTYELLNESLGYREIHKFGDIVTLGGLDFSVVSREEEFEESTIVEFQVQPLRRVANDYITRMSIAPQGQAQDILALSIIGKVPEKSQDFLNTLMLHFNTEGVADKRQVAENTASFIQERLKLISEELDSVETGIAEFKRENQLMDVTGRAGEVLAKSSMAEEEIFNLETQLMIIRSIREALSSAESYRLLPTNVGEGSVAGPIQQYNTLVQQRKAYLETSTAKNPVVETLTEQLDDLKVNLLQNIQSTINSISIRLEELNQLDRRAEGAFSTFPGMEKGIRSRERQQQIKEQLYLFLLQRREESAIAFAATSPVAKVIDPAYTISSPVDPRPIFILLVGFAIGLLIPLLIIFLRIFLDTKVHHKGDLNRLIKEIPFLGEIPRVHTDAEEVIQENDRSPLAESFRILRTNLAYLVQSRERVKGEVIFITSTIKGEGKTFVSYNLARTLASTKKKVLLIGADIRNPKLHKYTGDTMETKGLSDFLYDYEITRENIIKHTNEGGIDIDIILSGSIPPNPAELFMNDRMKTLIRQEEKNYDYIIVDTAPTMIVTDTLLISPLADSTLYVVRAGLTDKKLLDFPRDLKQQGKLKGLAIVLNDVDYSKFSYGAKYGYSYGYGYGYGKDEEKKSFFGKMFSKMSS